MSLTEVRLQIASRSLEVFGQSAADSEISHGMEISMVDVMVEAGRLYRAASTGQAEVMHVGKRPCDAWAMPKSFIRILHHLASHIDESFTSGQMDKVLTILP